MKKTLNIKGREKKMTTKRRSLRIVICALSAVFALNSLACAGMIYDFDIFNNPAYENDPRLNFTLTISDEGLSSHGKQKVGFTFNNNSTADSSITDIYFDTRPDDGLLRFYSVSIIEGQGVEFSESAEPKSLPGGELLTPSFDKHPDFSADSDSPTSRNGINPNEELQLIFTLDYGKTIDDIITAIANGGSYCEQSLRVGIHIQSLPQDTGGGSLDDYQASCCPPVYDNSASAINYTEPIPEPATIAFLGFGALSLIHRKKGDN
jgi:hypothetical protein